MVEITAAILGLGIALVFLGVTNLMRLDRVVAGRLRHYALAEAPRRETPRPTPRGSWSDRLSDRVNRALAGRSVFAGLRAELARADVKLTPGEFLLGQAALTFSLMLVGYNLVAVVSRPNLLAIPVFGLVGYFLPKLWLARRAAARRRAFNGQLPDTIALMANALRSGMSLLQAMDLAAREAGPPISEEFARVVREVGLGLAPEEALRHLRQRIRSDDVGLLVTAIIVQHEVGGNLAQLLDTIAETVRERTRLKGEIQTITTQERVSGYVLALMPVVAAVLLTLVNPRWVTSMFVMPYLVLPIGAAIGVIVGLLIIRQIVESIEV
jgi:tight adherence protein B